MREAIELSIICLLFGVHPLLSGAVLVGCLLSRVLSPILILGEQNENSNKSKEDKPNEPE